MFGLTREGRRDVVEPSVAVVFESGSTYHVDHPTDDGDRCAVLLFDEDVLEDAFGGRPRAHIRLTPRTQLAAWLLSRGAGWDAFDRESLGLLMIEMLAADADARAEVVLGAAQRRRVGEAASLLAARPTEAWTVSDVARAVHVSPFHLARQFRSVIGTTLARYLLRLRLSVVLEALAGGAGSLGRVATDAGFSHHSHMSHRFRSVFGVTPTTARSWLTAPRLQEMKEMLAAVD